MTFKITYDETDNPIEASVWMKLNKLSSELDVRLTDVKIGKYGWVDADNEEQAIEKAKNLVIDKNPL